MSGSNDDFKDLLGDEFEEDFFEDSEDEDKDEKKESLVPEVIDSKGGSIESLKDRKVGKKDLGSLESFDNLDQLTPAHIQEMLMKEVDRGLRLNNPMDIIEDILSRNRDLLMRKSDEQLMELYKMFAAKQRNIQNFTTRILELGVKTKILDNILNTGDDGFGGIEKYREKAPKVSAKAKRYTNMIRNEMDRRLGISDEDENKIEQKTEEKAEE